MQRQRDEPYIYVTWLTKLLMGSNSCQWAPWFMAHYRDYEKMPSDFDSVQWKVDHTVMLDKIEAEYAQRFQRIRREKQNNFQYLGGSGAILSGTPDLVCFSDKEVVIVDAKTGQQQDEHWAQMMIYLFCYPRVFSTNVLDREVRGEIIYKDGTKQGVYTEELTDAFRQKLTSLLQTISSTEQPQPTPSYWECNYCKITPMNCAVRIDKNPESEQVELGDF